MLCSRVRLDDTEGEYLHGQLSGWLQYERSQRSVSRLCRGVLFLLSVRSGFRRRLAVQQLQYGQTERQRLP